VVPEDGSVSAVVIPITAARRRLAEGPRRPRLDPRDVASELREIENARRTIRSAVLRFEPGMWEYEVFVRLLVTLAAEAARAEELLKQALAQPRLEVVGV
jgi:hypothetical protein